MFNRNEMTDTCVELTIERAGVDCDILVVDDGSEENYDNVKVNVLRLEENSGFTNAVNKGILWCADIYKYVHLLNNDTEPEFDFIKHLYEVMEADNGIGIASSSRIHKNNDEFLYIENYGLDLVRGHQLISKMDLPSEVIDVEWLPTCSSLIRMDMIREIGLFDKRFRNHCSDAEYCVRARMWDWRVVLVPKSRVLHHWSQTTMANHINPEDDQRKFIGKLAGLQYAELMKRMPLDCEKKTYGQLQFMTYSK